MLALRLQMGHIRVGESRPRHLGKSLLMRFRKVAVSSARALSSFRANSSPSACLRAVACFLSPALEAWPCHSEVWLQALW